MDPLDYMEEYLRHPDIVVIGVGNGGTNTINRLAAMEHMPIETISINTDRQALDYVRADKRILIGKSLTGGAGAKGDSDVGIRAAEFARPNIEKLVEYAEVVIITAGLGGGTGSGAAPIIARIAKEQGAIVMGIVSYPFPAEKARFGTADEGLASLRDEADSVFLLDCKKMEKNRCRCLFPSPFIDVDWQIADVIRALVDRLEGESLLPIKYSDLNEILPCGGIGTICSWEGKISDAADTLARDCLSHPLHDLPYQDADGCLILIEGGNTLSYTTAGTIAEAFRANMNSGVRIMWDVSFGRTPEDSLHLYALLTRFEKISPEQKRRKYSPWEYF